MLSAAMLSVEAPTPLSLRLYHETFCSRNYFGIVIRAMKFEKQRRRMLSLKERGRIVLGYLSSVKAPPSSTFH
jgi:hypothetical protein